MPSRRTKRRRARHAPDREPTAIDLFSGCGGLTLGLKAAGFKVLAAVENEPIACETYRLNHEETFLVDRDITKTRPTYLRRRLGLEPGELDLLAGCPPCQGFSKLRTLNGKRKIEEPMNDLVFQFLKYIRVFRPNAIMMENVPGLAKDGRLQELMDELHDLGYQYEARILNAADFGAPQRRTRMIMIAMHGGKPRFARRARISPDVRTAIGGLHRAGTGKDLLHDYKVNRDERIKDLIKKVPVNGGSRTDLAEGDQLDCHKKCDGFTDIYGRMAWNKPSPTITGGCINPSKGRFLHPRQHRAITLREASLLQGFPADYQFDLSKGRFHVAQLIGNAFPPTFAERHARVIRKQLASQ